MEVPIHLFIEIYIQHFLNSVIFYSVILNILINTGLPLQHMEVWMKRSVSPSLLAEKAIRKHQEKRACLETNRAGGSWPSSLDGSNRWMWRQAGPPQPGGKEEEGRGREKWASSAGDPGPQPAWLCPRIFIPSYIFPPSLHFLAQQWSRTCIS